MEFLTTFASLFSNFGNLTWQIVGTDGKVKAGKKDTKIKEEKKVWKKISFEKQGVTIKTSDTSDTSDSQN